MSDPIRPSTTTLRITPAPARGRQTPPPPERRFRQALGTAAAVTGHALGLMAGGPGGPRLDARDVSAALRDGGGVSPAGSPRATGLGRSAVTDPALGASVSAASGVDGVDYLRLQERIGAETRRFTTLSNVMKARHDAAQTAINNIG